MKWFNDLKLRSKLLSSFVLVAVLAGVVGYVGVTNIKAISVADTRLYENMTLPMSTVAEMATEFQLIRIGYRDVILARDAAEQQKYAAALGDAEKRMEKAQAEFEKAIISEFFEFTHDKGDEITSDELKEFHKKGDIKVTITKLRELLKFNGATESNNCGKYKGERKRGFTGVKFVPKDEIIDA